MEKDCTLVTTLEGIAYVRVLTNEGVTAKIPIEDFVAIVTKNVAKINYSNHLVNCNTLKENQVIAAYQWENAPVGGIAILEVFRYSGDWVIQRFTVIESSTIIWVRSFHNADTWGAWEIVTK